jgi:hypothetical protein
VENLAEKYTPKKMIFDASRKTIFCYTKTLMGFTHACKNLVNLISLKTANLVSKAPFTEAFCKKLASFFYG